MPGTLLALLLLTSSSDRTVTLDAKHWWNPVPIQIPDDRTYVVLLFSTQLQADWPKIIDSLHKLDSRPDVVVMALSAEPKARVEPFVEKHKIRFAVGAGATLHRRLGIWHWPKLLIWRSSPGRASSLDCPVQELTVEGLRELERALEAQTSQPSDSKSPPTTQPTGSAVPPAELNALRRQALQADDFADRVRALRRLREMLPPEPFLAICDEMLAGDPPPSSSYPPSYYRRIEYERQLGDPSVREKRPFFCPSEQVLFGTQPMGAVDRVAVELRAAAYEDMPPEALLAEYMRCLEEPDSPVSLMLRVRLQEPLEKLANTHKALLRDISLELFTLEPDPALRSACVLHLMLACPPGDIDTARHVEQFLEAEADRINVRPVIRYVLEYLYTGVD